MFKKIKQIDDKVLEFTPTTKGVVYISHKIGEKIYKLIKHEGENIIKDDPQEFIYDPKILGESIVVGRFDGNGFLYNKDFSQRKTIDFKILKSIVASSLFLKTISTQGMHKMGCLDNITRKIEWELNYSSLLTFFGKNIFYAVKTVDKKNNHIYAYDKKTGEEKWLYVIEQDELYGQVKFYAEHNGQIFIAHKEKLHAHDCDTGEILSSTSTYYGQIYYENKVPHILSFFSKFNLDTLEEILFDFKPLLVPYWGDYQKTTYMDCLVEGNILIGTHESFVTTNSPEEAAFHLLLIDPDKNEVVWSHEFPYKGLSNYKEARYENGKLYFLDKDGCLTIFEKEA